MRVSKDRLVIAIYGESAVGKSAVAQEVASVLHAHLRSCGEIIKAHAIEMGIPSESLPVEVHAQIDAATQRAAEDASSPLVIEGRYLDRVCATIEGVHLFRLTCSDVGRASRFAQRERVSSRSSVCALKERDAVSAQHREALYGARCSPVPTGTDLNTTGLSVQDVAHIILKVIKDAKNDETEPSPPISGNDGR